MMDQPTDGPLPLRPASQPPADHATTREASRSVQPGPGPLQALAPSYFALTMSTGIVSVASHLLGFQTIAVALFWFNLLFYAVLSIAFTARALIFPHDFFGDLLSHTKGPGYLTIVAGTSLLGTQVWLFTSLQGAAVVLWWLTLALWVLIIYSFFTAAVVREPKPPLETGINGGWMLIVTATQSISTLGSYVIEALPAKELMLFICLGFFMLGGMLYIVLTGLIVYRALFFRMEPDQLNPPYWINMGAVAITTLAGSRLILLGEPGPLAASLHPFLPAFVMLFWATATWWIPLLVLVGLWKIIVSRSTPRYGVGLWSMVFPLGTYAAATWTYATALQLDFLTWIPGWFIIIAYAAWLVTAFGMGARLVTVARGLAWPGSTSPKVNRHRQPSHRTIDQPAAEPLSAAIPSSNDDPRRLSLAILCLLALVVGSVTGVGAVAFRDLIGLVHNLLFLGQASFAYNSSLFTPASPWGPFVILVPVFGGMGVTFIVTTFAPEARGHGVPEVMDAIYYGRGIIRPIVAVAKSLASALAIGSGSAVGREGPIIQIGSALGSTLGQVIRMAVGQRIILVAAGAGAGIAATFNTPIGGVMFATELMLPEISVNSFLPVALATGTATFIGRLFFGVQPAFTVPTTLASLPAEPSSAVVLLLYACLGAVIGVAAAGFIKGLAWAEDLFDRVSSPYDRHNFGMLAVGILIYSLMLWRGHYFVDGVGYDTIQATLTGQISTGWFLLVLFACKLFATSVSLGSGSSGGIFSPSLFMGATLGAGFAKLVSAALPGLPLSVPAFAMVGMGAMVGGGTGAAMTAITMVFEMTRDYDIVLPMILAVAVAMGVRRTLSAETIYTMKLVGRGHPIPQALHANTFLVRSARDVMLKDVLLLDEHVRFADFLRQTPDTGRLQHVVVTRGSILVGVIRVNTDLQRTVNAAGSDVRMGDIARRNFTIVRERAAAFGVIARMWRRGATMAVVVKQKGRPRADTVLGVITKEHIADAVASNIRLYPG
jgi:CIC family chloride channel protein